MKRAKYSADEDWGRPLKVKPEVDWKMLRQRIRKNSFRQMHNLCSNMKEHIKTHT